MNIKEVLSETSFINNSINNLGLVYNENAFAAMASAVGRLIEKFIDWIRYTVWPFIKKILKAIKNLIKKTKLGKKAFDKIESKFGKKDDPDAGVTNFEREIPEVKPEKEQLVMVMQYPTWLNYIANSIIVPGRLMKMANSTEDRADDIEMIEDSISDYIANAKEVNQMPLNDNTRATIVKQLEIMEKSVAAYERASKEIEKGCNELKNKLNGQSDNGSVMRCKNASAIIQMFMRKTAEILNLSSQIIASLQKSIG